MPALFLCLLALSALPVFSQTLSIISGNGLIVQDSFPSTSPLRVRATNAAGAGVQDVPIVWTVKSGEGQVVNYGQKTDAQGYAASDFFGGRLLQGESYVTAVVNASTTFGSVDFVVTTVSTRSIGGGFVGLPQAEIIEMKDTISGPPGSVVPRAFGITVRAQAGLGIGQGIPNVGVRIDDPEPDTTHAVCSGPGGVVFTNAQGNVYCDLILGSKPGFNYLTVVIGEIQEYVRRIPVTVTPGPACSFTVAPLAQGVPAAGGPNTLSVTVPANQSCAWSASTTTPWITLTSGATGQASGTVGYTVAANTGAARSGTISVAGQTVTINQAAAGTGPGSPITFTSTSPLPGGTVGVPFSLQLGITGGTAPFTWSATGTFSPGLGLTPSNGLIVGTPTVAGTFPFTVSVVDSTGASATRVFAQTIAPPGTGGSLTIATTTLADGAVGAAYQQSVTATGSCSQNPFGGGSVNWIVATGALPPGLSLGVSGSTSTLVGTPANEGVYTFSLRATDSCGRSDTKTFTLTITTTTTLIPMIATPSAVEFSVAFTAANSASQPIAISTGATNLTYTATSSAPWLMVTPATGGSTPGTLTAQAINIGAFTPGAYNATISIASGASNSPLVIPVTLRVSSPSNITVAPESMLFRHAPESPVSQQVLNVGGVSTGIRFAVTAATNSGGQWLTATPATGETVAVVSVTVNTTGLAPGTYTGSIRVVPDANASGARTVPITAIVEPQSRIAVDQTPLSFTGAGSQTLAVNTTGAPIPFTATTTGGPWLTVTPLSATSPATVTVSVNVAGLASGAHQGTVAIIPANTSQPISIPVTLTVSQNQPVITAVTNAASFAPGNIAPGELITIFGTNIGPASLTQADYDATGTLQTTVANYQVLFDGVPAPIIYAASGQVSAIVPWGVYGRTTTAVQVAFGGQVSNPLSLTVVDGAPGIFVLDANGQGAIINQDGSVNAQMNGAAPGDVIAIYATGGGQMDRQVFDGRIIKDAPFPKPLLPVGVRIGGRVADVTYAGAAPGLVAGMIQVNARIPVDTPRGTMVPIQIIVGTATSQTNVFVATRP